MTISNRYRRRLIIMVKEPRPGRVKTRLAQDIGKTQAAWWFRHTALELMRRLRDPRWQLIVAVTPDVEGLKSRVWPSDLMRMPQGQGGLGARMSGLLAAAPKGPSVIIGADIPGIKRHHIETAFRALGPNDMVFGPAQDGGFWLVGSQRRKPMRPNIFENVRWSSETTLADTLTGLPDQRIGLVNMLADVDTVADL